MARVSNYTDADRAAVWVALQANEGNVARSHRDTGIPEQTIRDWKKRWKDEPPEFETGLVEVVNNSFIERAEHVRDKLLAKYEEAVDKGTVNPDKFPVHLAILDDKIRLHRGMATSRTEQTLALPRPDEIRAMFQGLVVGALEAAANREQDIIDVELVEEQSVKELPAAS